MLPFIPICHIRRYHISWVSCRPTAERIRLYRERKQKCEEFRSSLPTLAGQSRQEPEAALWKLLLYLQGCVFLTAKGLKFTYKIKGGEMFVNRKSKSITQATVFMAFHKAMELGGIVPGPKKLGTFGASYLYPIANLQKSYTKGLLTLLTHRETSEAPAYFYPPSCGRQP